MGRTHPRRGKRDEVGRGVCCGVAAGARAVASVLGEPAYSVRSGNGLGRDKEASVPAPEEGGRRSNV